MARLPYSTEEMSSLESKDGAKVENGVDDHVAENDSVEEDDGEKTDIDNEEKKAEDKEMKDKLLTQKEKTDKARENKNRKKRERREKEKERKAAIQKKKEEMKKEKKERKKEKREKKEKERREKGRERKEAERERMKAIMEKKEKEKKMAEEEMAEEEMAEEEMAEEEMAEEEMAEEEMSEEEMAEEEMAEEEMAEEEMTEKESVDRKSNMEKERVEKKKTNLKTPTTAQTGQSDAVEYSNHMKLLRHGSVKKDMSNDINSTPIFTNEVRKWTPHTPGSSGKEEAAGMFTQYGLLAGLSPDPAAAAAAAAAAQQELSKNQTEGQDEQEKVAAPKPPDPRLFYNVAAPSSVFICGSQGSGKSHTLGCLLENCLLPSAANVLPRPLTGVVFHYDTFNSDTSGAPSEAAYLASSRNVQVRVLCAPTNRAKIKKIYRRIPNVVVEDFRIHESQLNTKRMLDLMAMGSVKGDEWPLYMHTVTRILREMRLEQQTSGETGFNYGDFKARLAREGLIGSQWGPLQQRLDALESFMVPQAATKTKLLGKNLKRPQKGMFKKGEKTVDDTWTPKPGRLTIVDLSCPCVTDSTACALFNICLSLFLEQKSDVGRVIALDEAHKYMKDSADSNALTESLLSAIRLQRHLAARIFISTQEPTVSPKVLDLCSVSIVHRFTSPGWLEALRDHLAGASLLARPPGTRTATRTGTEMEANSKLERIFGQIVSLSTGEALVFAPSAAIGLEGALSPEVAGGQVKFERLMLGVMRARIRNRVTFDGGKSILA